ncbi:Hypothetical predicted protein [Pelobates cultripes]|uniref:Uncharacterized protein n=1 Tax=Pelobates cultripes TaxID=61616 RepID=A0AAD1RGP3_PELCU|nr:Hypothetical predicted protein [Pelobates cultripes]
MSVARTIFKGIVLLEVAGVVGAYDFRYTMNRRFPSVLEMFYKSNEWAGIYGIRELDAEKWSEIK